MRELSQHEAQFVRAVGRVDVDQHHAGAGGAVLQQHPLDAVAGPDAGAVAGRESEAGQSAGHAGGFGIELAPGKPHALVADDQGFALGKRAGGRRARACEMVRSMRGAVGPAA